MPTVRVCVSVCLPCVNFAHYNNKNNASLIFCKIFLNYETARNVRISRKKDLADPEVRFLLLKTLRIRVCRAQ